MGSVYLLLATNVATRLGFLAGAHRRLRVADHPRHHLVDLRPTACSASTRQLGGRGDRVPRATVRRRARRLDARRRPTSIDTSRAARRRGGPRARRPSERRGARARSTPTTSTAGRCSPRPTPRAARPRPPSTSRRWPRPLEALGLEDAPRTTSPRTRSRRAARPSARATRAARPHHAQASRPRSAAPRTRPTTPSSRCSRSIEQETGARRAAAHARGRRGAQPVSSVLWSATSASVAAARPRSSRSARG